MKIFADKAKEIKDSDKISGNCRYSDNSSFYSKGFGYDYLLNSAMINGFLHRLTKQLEMLLHCSADNLPLNILSKPNVRYNSKKEIQTITYSDKKNYIKSDYWSVFYKNRIFPYLYKKQNINDINSNDTHKYLTANDVTNAIGVYYGHHAKPIKLEYETYKQCCAKTIQSLINKPSYIAQDGTIPCFVPEKDIASTIYVSVKIPISENPISVYVFGKSIETGSKTTRYVIPVINFEGVYRGNNAKTYNSKSNILVQKKIIFIVDNINKKVYMV